MGKAHPVCSTCGKEQVTGEQTNCKITAHFLTTDAGKEYFAGNKRPREIKCLFCEQPMGKIEVREKVAIKDFDAEEKEQLAMLYMTHGCPYFRNLVAGNIRGLIESFESVLTKHWQAILLVANKMGIVEPELKKLVNDELRKPDTEIK